jgi:cellulose synthase operon protein C
VLKRALSVAGGATGVRAEVLAVMTEAYRAEGKLTELVEILEKEPGQDFQRLTTLGRILEETGQVDKALVAYRKALAIDGAHVDTRVRVVHLLQTTGELDLAIKEYEALIRSAPNASEYVFELCETLIQRGDRPKALRLLEELERRAGGDGDTLAAVADFYERVEERDKAMKVLQRLASSQTGDPTFLVDLGDRYYQAGDKKRALETWAKIPRVSSNRARASLTLGEVYLDHDMPTEALAALREALSLEPDSLPTKKALAIALERTAPGTPQAAARFQEAVTLWEEMLAASGRDVNLAREARTHIVSIWSVTKELAARSAPLQARFAASPPDLEAGRLLAEVQRKLGQLPAATSTLRSIIAKAPGDEPSMLALERVLVQQHDLLGAIEVLEKLAELNPKAARQYYQRMAQYAAELYRDDDAIRYAAKAVELSPDDANGHQKLGDMYRKRQDIPNAIARYRQAIAKNDRLFIVYFDLAELLLSTGDVAEADRLFRRVVRASGDEELVARAARASMQINLGKGSLETLERELLPVAVGNPQKPMYRRLLVELYGAMTMPLVQKVRHGEDAAEIAKARAELSAIGTRAVKPLLDALGDERDAQQRIAIEVLAYVENKNAGPSLFNFATGQADRELRTRAMVAVGALRDPAMLPKLAQLLEPVLPPERGDRGGERAIDAAPAEQISLAAAWAVARTPGPKSEDLLARLLEASSPDVRAVAAIGLATAPTNNARRHAVALVSLAKAPDAGPRARAAALAALGELVHRGLPAPNELEQLAQGLLDAPDALLRRTALGTSAQVALAGSSEGGARRPGSADFSATVDRAIAQAVFDRDPALRSRAVAVSALRLERQRPGVAPARADDPLAVPDGRLDVDDMLRALAPRDPDDRAKATALVALETPLRLAATAAVTTSAERAAVVGDALASQILAPFAPESELPPELAARAAASTRAILESAAPGFAGLARHSNAALRARAAQVLAREGSDGSTSALARALEQGDAEARRGILSAIEAGRPPGLIGPVVRALANDESWAVRVRAAETLASLGTLASAREPALAALETAASGDRFALVREAALRALHGLDPARAAPTLRAAATSDAEPRVRTLATELLGQRSTAAPATAPAKPDAAGAR